MVCAVWRGAGGCRYGYSLNWLLGDHLGSTSMAADANGEVISEIRYTAFGETRYENGVTPTDYRYTGQREEAELGLYYYVARWYDPALGRFTQADTIVPNPGSAKAYDRYAYVMNNPLKYTDPSGHQGDTPCTISGNCVEEWENEDGGGGGGGGEPGNNDEDIVLLVCGTNGTDASMDGPLCGGEDGQMIPWTYNIDSQYWVQYQGGKENTADWMNDVLELLNVDGNTNISLICYSGGADACEIFYDKYSNDYNIKTMVLMGASPPPSGDYKGGDLSEFSLGILTKAVNDGVNVLFLDDIGVLPVKEGTRWAPTIDPNSTPGIWVSTAGQCHHTLWACGPATNDDSNLVTKVLNWIANPGPTFP